jgi:hypothetical protein
MVVSPVVLAGMAYAVVQPTCGKDLLKAGLGVTAVVSGLNVLELLPCAVSSLAFGTASVVSIPFVAGMVSCFSFKWN